MFKFDILIIFLHFHLNFSRETHPRYMYDQTKKDNIKLTGLEGQMTEMDQDFEEMMRTRNEAKKRLEEKFKDVY